MRIGQYQLRNRLIAAPMAGITDRPFRTLCYEMGAGLTVSEMMSSNPQVWESDKSRLRMVHIDEPGIRTVQIAGSDPKEMADAARINVESGAQIIDINMGCPVPKIAGNNCGSALMKKPPLCGDIVRAVKNADGSFTYSREKYESATFKEHMHLYPIPNNEVYKSAVLEQNPGWK